MQENFYDPEAASSSGATRSTLCYSESQDHALPRFWVLQETILNDYLPEKDEPLLSSTIQRIWQLLLYNWDLTFRKYKDTGY